MESLLSKAGSHENDYRQGLRANVRAYWKGLSDRSQFIEDMDRTIRRGQRFAFAEGAALCGIKQDEYTDKEVMRIQDAIDYENQWVAGLADTIEQVRAEKGPLGPLLVRMEIWIGRYSGLRAEARTMACADRKLKWILGNTEKHCGSCVKLNGKVKRGSFWNERGILPRVHGAEYLECKGFR